MYIKTTFLISLLLFAGFNSSFAQVSKDDYGKNRVQYKDFNWRFYSSDNFDIYFYEGGQENALIAAKYLEKEFDRITDIVGYAPYSKTKIFLYNSVNDLQQSNVGVHERLYSVSGQTNFVKSQVEIAYPGNMEAFKNELVLQISRMLINDMMFGGSLTDMFQSAYLMSLPSWFIDGAARYIAEGWNIEMDDFMRDFFHHNKNIKLSRLDEEDAALAGQSVWNFIAAKYGKSSISNILNLTRIIRNEENSIVNTLGVPFKLFLRQWQSYYKDMSTLTDDAYIYPEEDNRIGRNKRGLHYKDLALSPNGQYLAYSENIEGKYKVLVKNLKSGRTKTVHKGGTRLINQHIAVEVPLLSWSDDQNIGVIGNKRGQTYLWIYNVNGGRGREILLGKINQVKSFDFNQNGRLVVMSADMNGQNDLFILNPNRITYKRLTNDIYDDLSPRFIPKTNKLVFSSNRPDDSLYYAPQKAKEVDLRREITDNFNVFVMDMDSEDSLLTRVTNTVSRDIKPIPKDEYTIYYLSDQQGIYNLYEYNLRDSIFHQVSNFALSIQDYDANFSQNTLAYTMLSDENDRLYLDNDFNFDNSIFTPQTQRQQAMQARMVAERLSKNRKSQLARQSAADSSIVADSLPSAIQSDNVVPMDSLPPALADSIAELRDSTTMDTLDLSGENMVNTEDYQFQQDSLPDDLALGEGMIDTENYTFNNPEEGELSTDNFAFEDEELSEDNNTNNSFLARYRKLQRETRIEGPFPYQTRFSADNVVTSLVIDPLRKFGFQMEVQMNDMLEDHRFYGGLVQFTDLKSGSLFAEYEYLKKRVDFSLKYQREGIYTPTFSNAEDDIQKYTMNRFQAGASLPFNGSSRLEFSPFILNTQYLNLSNLNASAGADNVTLYGGFKTGLVIDNTLSTSPNKYEGTRMSLFFTHQQGINDPAKSFSNLQLDVRHYQKIHRELTLATRLFYGNFFGANPQRYLLGGMSNWLFNKRDQSGNDDPLAINAGENTNILFAEFADLRGFNYNKFNGQQTMTFTAELRLPIVRYLYRGPITSNFFRNLEFIGFYDVGSAWTGASPFSEKNSLNTEVITAGEPGEPSTITVEVQNFKNPWIQSYGAGVRTVLLGYYLKLDMAYPIEDNIVGDKPRFYITLGYDF